jgi:hypothetical protein
MKTINPLRVVHRHTYLGLSMMGCLRKFRLAAEEIFKASKMEDVSITNSEIDFLTVIIAP